MHPPGSVSIDPGQPAQNARLCFTLLGIYTAAGSGLAVYTVAYDAAANRTDITEIDGTRVTFGYDGSYQLVNEQRSGVNAYNVTFGYDGPGNRTLKNDSGQVTTYSLNAVNEVTLLQPPSGQPTTSGYDGAGNLTVENSGGQLTSYGWDGENRLTGVSYPSGAPDTFSYSADSLRQKKVTSGGTVNMVWDQQNVLLEQDATGATQAHYTSPAGFARALASQRRGTASSFYGIDPQSNVRLLASSGAAVTDQYLYRAFGEEVTTSGTTVNPFRFGGGVGYYRDLPARLYVRARHLRTDLGRWISRDPLRALGWGHLYQYAGNSPLGFIDPSGLRHCNHGSVWDPVHHVCLCPASPAAQGSGPFIDTSRCRAMGIQTDDCRCCAYCALVGAEQNPNATGIPAYNVECANWACNMAWGDIQDQSFLRSCRCPCGGGGGGAGSKGGGGKGGGEGGEDGEPFWPCFWECMSEDLPSYALACISAIIAGEEACGLCEAVALMACVFFPPACPALLLACETACGIAVLRCIIEALVPIVHNAVLCAPKCAGLFPPGPIPPWGVGGPGGPPTAG